jgi:hypothetical protein
MDGTATFVIIVFLSTAIERTIEAVINPPFDALAEGKYHLPRWEAGQLVKRFVGVVLGLGAGFAIAFGLKLDLFNPLLGGGTTLSALHAKIFTGILLGGGSAPAHEVIRYVEEKKGKAEGEKDAAKAEAEAAEAKAKAAKAELQNMPE